MNEPGIHDPTWYESLVGLLHVVDLFDPDTAVDSVTFQNPDTSTIDDVVVRYSDTRPATYYQVKSASKPGTFTHDDLLASGKDHSKPLLSALALGWAAERRQGPCEVVLYTRKALGTSRRKTRPPLARFWPWLKSETEKGATFGAIVVPPDWQGVFAEWATRLDVLKDDDERSEFLRSLRISAGRPSLDELDEQLRARISAAFQVSEEQATELRRRLHAAMRKWATRTRGNSVSVTHTSAYEELSDGPSELAASHATPAPQPFFPSRELVAASLADRLRDGPDPIVFLTGEPGCGKSSVVSVLADRGAIDFRFYTFVPLDPQGSALPRHDLDITSARVLWGDLLSQVRQACRGQLAHLKVPLVNEFLDAAKRREAVLSVAGELSKNRGYPVVVAIDGLDHCARVKGSAPVELLDSIPRPSAVPYGIRLLIAGQPPTDADGYPAWLRTKTTGVFRLDMPRLRSEDVRSLTDWNVSRLWGQQADVERVIIDVAKGNALVARFAMRETLLSTSFADFEQRLADHRLGDDLAGYYDRIWTAALRSVGVPAISRRLEACFALARDPITAADLTGFFAELSTGQAGEVLLALRPLVVEHKEQAGRFGLHHDNIRVHLMARARQEPSVLRQVASAMADHYLSAKNGDLRTRHSAGFDLLEIAGRRDEWGALVDTNYVLEGWACGRSLTELGDHLFRAIDSTSEGRPNWLRLHGLACAAMTLRQIEAALQWSTEERETVDAEFYSLPTVLEFERAVVPRSEWSHDLLRQLLGTVLGVHRTDPHRASTLAERWLSGVVWADVLPLPARRRFPKTAGRDFDMHTGELFELWGRVAFLTGVGGAYPEGEAIEQVQRPIAFFHAGVVAEAVKSKHRRKVLRLMKPRYSWLPRKVEQVLREAMLHGDPGAVATALVALLPQRTAFSIRFRVQVAAWASCSDARNHLQGWSNGDASLTDEELCDALQARGIENLGAGVEDTWALAGYALVKSLTTSGRSVDAAARDITEAYFERGGDGRRREATRTLLSAAGWVGKLLLVRDKGPDAQLPPRCVVELTCGRLLRIHQGLGVLAPFDDPEIGAHLFHGLLRACRANSELASWVSECVLERVSHGYRGPARKHLWRWLKERGRSEELRLWLESVIGAEGAAWDLEIADRVRVVDDMCSLAEGDDLAEIVASARERVRWTWASYVGHKDYSLSDAADWAAEIVQRGFGNQCHEEFVRLTRLSETASQLGDNRERRWIESLMTDGVGALRKRRALPRFTSVEAWRHEVTALARSIASRRANRGDSTRKRLIRCLRRAVAGKALLDSTDLDRAFKLFDGREEHAYGWTVEWLTPALEALAEILTEQQFWALLLPHIRRFDKENRGLWVYGLAGDLNALCLMRARSAADLRAGLDRVLSAHEAWLSGDGRFPVDDYA